MHSSTPRRSSSTQSTRGGIDPTAPLLPEDRVIEMLGLQNRPNPKGSLQWLRRTGQLGFVQIGRGIYAYPKGTVHEFMRDRFRPPISDPPLN
jgi:hypothetical protein